MNQLLFLSPLIIALILCAYSLKSYISKDTRTPDPSAVVKLAMDTSGYTQYENTNRHKSEKFSLTVRQGMTEIRQQMDLVADQHRNIMDQMAAQKQKMEDQKRSAQAIKDIIAHNNALGINVDMMRINGLLDVLDHQDQILKENDARLLALNDRVKEKTLALDNQMRMADMGNSHDADYIRDKMELLRNKSSDLMQTHGQFVQSANQYVDLAHEQAKGVTQQLTDTNNYLTSLRGPSNSDLKDRVKELLYKEQDMMTKIRDNQALINQHRQEIKQRMETISERMQDLVQRNDIKIDDARMKAEDLNRQNKERIADQMQRIRQQQLDRKR